MLISLTADGRTRHEALVALVRELNHQLGGVDENEPDRSVRVLAEGKDDRELIRQLIDELLVTAGEEPDTAALAVDGLSQRPDGWVGWGRVLTGTRHVLLPSPELEQLDCQQMRHGWRIEAIIRLPDSNT